jgi:hypothetical protein
MSPPDAVESPGVFWLDGGPRVRGMLVREGADGHVLTEGVVREPRSVRFRSGPGWIGMDDLGDPKEIVADTVPIPLLGTLDDGRAITLIDAQLRQTEVTRRQTFHGIRLLDGAHAPDPEATFPAARLALPQPGFWRGLLDGPGTATVDLPDVSGSLRAFADDGRLWVELTLRSGLTIFEWERRFWSRCLTLLRLWTDRDLREDHAQIMTSAGDWSEFVALRSKHSESFTVHDSLLPPGSLALGTLAKALVLFDKLAPVPDIAARNLVGHVTLELAVLANASCLEGLHRRCHENSRPFPSMRGKKVGKVSRAAAEAAVAKAIELGTIGPEDRHASVTRMEEALGFHNEPTFAERLRELLPAVESATPGLIGQNREAWITAVKQARNFEAHRLVEAKGRESYEERTDEYYQLAVSIEWVLRISLLLHLGVEPGVLHARLHEHQKFAFTLANMDRSRYPWPGSRVDEFRASRPGPPSD